MNCDEVRRAIESSAGGKWPDDLSAHLAACEACLQHALTEALATPPAIVVPAGFADHVAFPLPQRGAPRIWPHWPIVASAVLSSLVLAVGLWMLVSGAGPSGRDPWVTWYQVVFLAAAGESAVLIAWAWEPFGQVNK